MEFVILVVVVVAAIVIYRTLREIGSILTRIAVRLEAQPGSVPVADPRLAQADAGAEAARRQEWLRRQDAARPEGARPDVVVRPQAPPFVAADVAFAPDAAGPVREPALDAARQEAARQDLARQDAARQEAWRRSEVARQEVARQETFRLEMARRDTARREAARQGASGEGEAAGRRQEPSRQQEAVRLREDRLRELARQQEFATRQGSAGDPASSPGFSSVAPEGRRPGFDWEMFAGGRLFNILGALTLIIGVGLLFKYAFDTNLIGVWGRVAGGVVLGGAVVGAGHVARVRSKGTWFSDGIIGTGFGTLYLSGYAAFAAYHLVPFPVAYAYMSCVTLVAFGLGLRYDSMWVSLIGWAGGFLSPFVLGDVVRNELGFAAYLVVLDLGMAAIGVVKARWFAMQPLAMAATYVGIFVWYRENAAGIDWFVSTIALVSIWLVFFAAGVANSLRAKELTALDGVLSAFNGLLFASYLFAAVGDHRGGFDAGMAFVACAYAVSYVMTVRRVSASRALRTRAAVGTAAFAFLATLSHELAYEERMIAGFALESLAVLAFARVVRARWKSGPAPELLAIGFGFLGCGWAFRLSLVDLASTARSVGDLATIVLVLVTVAVERMYAADRLGGGIASPTLRAFALLGTSSLVIAHAHDGYGDTLAFAAIALVLGGIGTRWRFADLEVEALVAIGIAHAFFWSDPRTYGAAAVATPFIDVRFATLASLSAATIALGEIARRRGTMSRRCGRPVRLIGAIAFTFGSTIEIHDGFRAAIARLRGLPPASSVADAIARLVGGEPLAVMALWLGVSIVMIALGVRFRIREFRLYAIAVFAMTILKAFYDLRDLENPYKIFAFMGLGVTLLGVSALYSRLETGFFARPDAKPETTAPSTA